MNKQTIEVDVDQVVGVAICAAMHSRSWDNETSWKEVYQQDNGFKRIIETAQNYCESMGLGRIEILPSQVIYALWSSWEEEFEAFENRQKAKQVKK